MSQIKFYIYLVVILLSSYASSDTKQQQKKQTALNDTQLKALLVGKTMHGKRDAKEWSTKFKVDGTMLGKYGKKASDIGIYVIKNNGFCSRWNTWRNMDTSCWIVVKRSNDYYGKLISGASRSFNFNIK